MTDLPPCQGLLGTPGDTAILRIDKLLEALPVLHMNALHFYGALALALLVNRHGGDRIICIHSFSPVPCEI